MRLPLSIIRHLLRNLCLIKRNHHIGLKWNRYENKKNIDPPFRFVYFF